MAHDHIKTKPFNCVMAAHYLWVNKKHLFFQYTIPLACLVVPHNNFLPEISPK